MNIDLDLVADVNLDRALCALAATLSAGRRTHRSGIWRTKSVEYHIGRARRHLDLILVHETSEDHLSHALAQVGNDSVNEPATSHGWFPRTPRMGRHRWDFSTARSPRDSSKYQTRREPCSPLSERLGKPAAMPDARQVALRITI